MRTTLKTICAAGAAGLGIVYGAMTFTPASSWSLWLAGRVGFAQAAAFPSCVCRRRPRRSCGDCSLEALCARASQKATKRQKQGALLAFNNDLPRHMGNSKRRSGSGPQFRAARLRVSR